MDDSGIEMREAGSKDLSAVLEAFDGLPPRGFLSQASGRLQRAYVKRLLASWRGTVVLSTDRSTGRPAGYVLVTRDTRRFWIEAILRNPITIGPEVLARKRSTLIPNLLDRRVPMLELSLPMFLWSESRPETARIVFVGVLPNFRRRGVGGSLYASLAEVLRAKGCTLVEAHIDAGNTPSVALHERAGWQVERLEAGDYKAVLRLD